MPSAAPLAQRFWKKVSIGLPGECWEWRASKDTRGYGHIWADRSARLIPAHRVSWELHNGPIPEGLHVLHRCDNRGCVNPAHLFLGSHADNMADKVKKGRASRMPGERHPNAKLTDALVREIRSAPGYYHEVAARFGVSKSTVHHIMSGRSWKHVA